MSVLSIQKKTLAEHQTSVKLTVRLMLCKTYIRLNISANIKKNRFCSYLIAVLQLKNRQISKPARIARNEFFTVVCNSFNQQKFLLCDLSA